MAGGPLGRAVGGRVAEPRPALSVGEPDVRGGPPDAGVVAAGDGRPLGFPGGGFGDGTGGVSVGVDAGETTRSAGRVLSSRPGPGTNTSARSTTAAATAAPTAAAVHHARRE
ncbi:hypothetical protein DZF91_37640, partial [Actinomadura logoneensis]